MIRRNYDVIATAGTAGVLMIVHAPWPFWLVWGGITAYQATNRWRARTH